MKVGFIGLGNVGSKLAGSLLRNGFDLAVRDIDRSAAAPPGGPWGGLGAQPCRHGRQRRRDHHLPAQPGRHILHTGPVGSAAILKVVTNYLATAYLVSLCEALATSRQAGIDLNTAYEAIRISSGNSFVHETESQVILNGSRNINFTMDLVVKDLSLFTALAERCGMPLELVPVLVDIFDDAAARYGPREWSRT